MSDQTIIPFNRQAEQALLGEHARGIEGVALTLRLRRLLGMGAGRRREHAEHAERCQRNAHETQEPISPLVGELGLAV